MASPRETFMAMIAKKKAGGVGKEAAAEGESVAMEKKEQGKGMKPTAKTKAKKGGFPPKKGAC